MNILKPFVFALISMNALQVSAQSDKLPATWERDFVITLSYDNTMGQAHTDLRLTYDSCIYEVQNRDGRNKKATLMTENERRSILKKLHELKVNKIKSGGKIAPMHDGWSESICFGFHCVEGGAGVDLSDDDKNRFLDAYRYLEDFAAKKKK